MKTLWLLGLLLISSSAFSARQTGKLSVTSEDISRYSELSLEDKATLSDALAQEQVPDSAAAFVGEVFAVVTEGRYFETMQVGGGQADVYAGPSMLSKIRYLKELSLEAEVGQKP